MKKLMRALAMVAVLGTSVPAFAQDGGTVDTGNTTWILISAALVMLMTPGLAFFYAGMVSRKNVVSTLLQNFAALAVISIIWAVIGFSLVFSEGTPFLGGLDYVMLAGLGNTFFADGIPYYAFVAFQMTFAIITPALITGSIAERVNFTAWILFMILWSLGVYAPIAHWVWGPGGWIANDGGLDFAGGLVVHCSSGVSALVAAMMFGKRMAHGEHHRPNDVSMIMLGAALLWFGWFGFNAGSALSAGFLAAHAFMATFLGAAAAFITWMLTDWALDKKPTAMGAAIGLVVGLVVITPAAGFVSLGAAMIMCAIGGVVCNLVARFVKKATHLDDALDVFACHGVGGIVGALLTGLFASTAVNEAVTVQGLFISGEFGLFKANLVGVVSVAIYAAVATYILLKLVDVLTPIRVSEAHEAEGLDQSLHGEYSRYDNVAKAPG